jgi:WD40 repeat protein
MGSGLTRVIWLEHGDGQDGSGKGNTLDSFDPGHPVQSFALADDVGYAVAGPDHVTVVWRPSDGGLLGSLEIPEAGVSCMAMFSAGDSTILLVTGHHSGELALAEIVDGRVAERWRAGRHEASVTSVAFLDRDRIVSGGLDRAVRVTPAANPADSDGSLGATMRLTLRCRGVRIDGVTPQRERDLLAKFSALSAQG